MSNDEIAAAREREIARRREFLETLSRQLADDGRLIEAGWVSLQAMAVPPDAPEVQVREMRNAFFAGAQHLFASIMTIMDPGDDEPTEDDLRRMTLISDELDAYSETLQAAAKRGRW